MARLVFSDTSNRTGIIQLIERDTNTQSATTSTYPLKVKTVDVNEALNAYQALAVKASGKWQFDDTNQTDYPVLTTNLVSGQSDYTFLYDGATTPNQILDLYTVRIKDSTGTFKQISMVDRTDFDVSKYDGQTGTPVEYDLTSDGIILYPQPNYNSTAGLEIYVARAPSYFVSTDTTKVAGIPETFHSYLHLRPSYFYALVKSLPNAKALGIELDKLERAISDYHSQRVRVEKPALRVKQQSNK